MFPPHQLPQYEITPEVLFTCRKHDLLEDDRSTSLSGTFTLHGYGGRL